MSSNNPRFPFRKIQTGFFVLIILVEGVLVLFYLQGVRTVPFHPDETTYLFMSSDFELLISQPFNMAWNRIQEDNIRQHYREVDAPLSRYIIGLGRVLNQQQALKTDWNWSKTWEENQLAGAIPGFNLLQTGRLSIGLLFPFSLYLLYLNGKNADSKLTGFLATIIFSLNALILLHDRRAMAEGVMSFGIIFAMWSFLKGNKYPWLAGLGLAIAFNAKHSCIALFPVGILAVTWFINEKDRKIGKITLNLFVFIIIFLVVTLLLNPLYWKNPIQALQASINARLNLTHNQVSDAIRLSPDQHLDTPIIRMGVYLANLYITKPSFAEVGNYESHSKEAIAAYLGIPANNLWRTPTSGGILLFLTLLGILYALRRPTCEIAEKKRVIILLLSGTLVNVLFSIFFVTIPWQRYVIPVVSFICLWQAYAISYILKIVTKTIKSPLLQRGL